MENNLQPLGAHLVQQFEDIFNHITDPETIVVVSTAPAPRTALGEVFGEQGNAQGKIVAFLKSIGVDYVFDTTFGADLTTICEARELLARLENPAQLPLLNSCCPAFVKFIENFYPQLKSNLSTTLTPIANMGAYIKHVFAREIKVSAKNIYHIALTPCVAKKLEIKKQNYTLKNCEHNTFSAPNNPLSQSTLAMLKAIRKNYGIDPAAPFNALQSPQTPTYLTDVVITTNELATLIKLSGQNYLDITPRECDKICGNAIQFGHSGGVVKSVVECAYFLLNNALPPKNFVNFEKQNPFLYVANIELGKHKIKIAKIDGLKNWEQFVSENNLREFAFIEVMMCAGGCLGGTGQPKPADLDARKAILLQSQKHNSAQNAYANQLISDFPNLFINE